MKKNTPPKIINPQSIRVLIVEDSEDDALLIIRELKKGGYNPVYEWVKTAAAMKKVLKEKQWDIILCNYIMPKFSGAQAIALLKETDIDIPIIVVSGNIGEETALECVRLGAHDYVMKNNLSRLCPAVGRELEEAEVRNKQRQAENALRRSEEKYRTILNNIEDGYYEVDIKGNLIFFNDSMCRIIGYSPEEMMGMNNRQFTDKEHSKKLFKTFNEVYRTGVTAKALDWQIIRKDKTKRFIEVSVSLQKDSSGKPIGFQGIARDVTERKQAEDTLRESETKLQAIFDKVGTGIFIIDMDTQIITEVNPAAIEMIGLPKERITGQICNSLVCPALTGKCPVKDLGQIVHQSERKLIHADGHQIDILKTVYPITINGRNCYLESFIDISDRKKAEEAFRESEGKYRTILEEMEDVYFETDIKGNITFVNASSCKMSGYSEEELIGMPFKKISAPDDIEKIMQYFGEIFLTDKTGKPFLWNLVKKNREQGFFEIVVSLIRDKQGNPVGFRGIGRDITERRKAEAELQQTLESLRKSFGVTIQVMVSAVEMRDPYTAGHQVRTADLARAIAMEMGLPKDKIDGIRMAGSIHDIGKLSIPAEILSKPTKLTDIEFDLIKDHSQSGYEMLKDVESPWPLAQIVYQHHERMNGSGYPRNLKGNEIIIEARIMAVADVVEAMASHRPYRPGLGIDAALAEIEKNKGTHYDNTVVDACLRLFREKGYQLT